MESKRVNKLAESFLEGNENWFVILQSEGTCRRQFRLIRPREQPMPIRQKPQKINSARCILARKAS